MSFRLQFCIISRDNDLIFDCPLQHGAIDFQTDAFIQTIILGAMDQLEAKLSTTSSLYLKQIDKCSADWAISAYVTPGYTKFLLLHPQRLDDSIIKTFFLDIHEVYVRSLMSPFSDDNVNTNDILSDRVSEASKALLRSIK